MSATDQPSSLPARSPAELDFAQLISNTVAIDEKLELAARWILYEFDAYYTEYGTIPHLAKKAFETRNPAQSLALSIKRLSLYSTSIELLAPRLRHAFPQIADDESLWGAVERHYLSLIDGRYEGDLAFAYIHSALRKTCRSEWQPVEYSVGDSVETKADVSLKVYRSFPSGARVSPQTIADILEIPAFTAPYRNLAGDAALVAERVNRMVMPDEDEEESSAPLRSGAIRSIEMIDAGLYRNRGAYLVGRIVRSDGTFAPLIIALLNEPRGIYVDAVLDNEVDAHNIFSSTLANFHVTTTHYHELAAFMHSIMPRRPLGLHYSTIGFNHLGKVAVMKELEDELTVTGEVLQTAVGFRGTVAIGFASPSSAYNLKVIRDHPTAQYKWGEFEGIESVLRKYARVHEINRTGSMLDNIIYYHLKLDKRWFDAELLEELLRDASDSVSLQGEAVVLKYLIVQRRQTPLPVFLENATSEDAETAIVNLGYCIKNNAAANIFNKDLDARNYGVSKFLKVYLYDYDALEPFTDVKIRSNEDRVDGEEDVPDWYFEDGVVFLPEEIETGLQISSRQFRRIFREVHGDLLTTGYWQRIQNDLRAGRVPPLRVYPESRKLTADSSRG